ncbi:gag/pol/env polyprotein, putative [Perkinsus marinus ATCC 50983]|uniref:Gag/pol/env polyprotein, putative n=1 Tax=Perkinsus marinus (strain ATCC 50983 / TXsc) TaxID=423536 RepID=C5KZZ7_PERM5|nr:gag/pol/env polyprotein, putative [Perkinsus marinus ATCC 50983]EER09855.1 gag/pol/env polyprotein, putative [Perkinsus marinus ATCC 50983]|eukprot:XP_002778060.1 gag/pol/env polyprotein, putative [Perkinsus marinus ATCC 50983]
MTNNGSDASNGEEPSVTEFVSPSGSTLICGGAVPGTGLEISTEARALAQSVSEARLAQEVLTLREELNKIKQQVCQVTKCNGEATLSSLQTAGNVVANVIRGNGMVGQNSPIYYIYESVNISKEISDKYWVASIPQLYEEVCRNEPTPFRALFKGAKKDTYEDLGRALLETVTMLEKSWNFPLDIIVALLLHHVYQYGNGIHKKAAETVVLRLLAAEGDREVEDILDEIKVQHGHLLRPSLPVDVDYATLSGAARFKEKSGWERLLSLLTQVLVRIGSSQTCHLEARYRWEQLSQKSKEWLVDFLSREDEAWSDMVAAFAFKRVPPPSDYDRVVKVVGAVSKPIRERFSEALRRNRKAPEELLFKDITKELLSIEAEAYAVLPWEYGSVPKHVSRSKDSAARSRTHSSPARVSDHVKEKSEGRPVRPDRWCTICNKYTRHTAPFCWNNPDCKNAPEWFKNKLEKDTKKSSDDDITNREDAPTYMVTSLMAEPLAVPAVLARLRSSAYPDRDVIVAVDTLCELNLIHEDLIHYCEIVDCPRDELPTLAGFKSGRVVPRCKVRLSLSFEGKRCFLYALAVDLRSTCVEMDVVLGAQSLRRMGADVCLTDDRLQVKDLGIAIPLVRLDRKPQPVCSVPVCSMVEAVNYEELSAIWSEERLTTSMKERLADIGYVAPVLDFDIPESYRKTPYQCQAPYNIPAKLVPGVHDKIRKEVLAGHWEEVAPTASMWISPCFAKAKGRLIEEGPAKGEEAVRLLVDLRRLNTMVDIPDYFRDDGLSAAEFVRQVDQSARYFTTVDVEAAFESIPAAPRAQDLMCFAIGGRVYRSKVALQGLGLSPLLWQYHIRHGLQTLLGESYREYCAIFMDDILIWGDTADQCERRRKVVVAAINALGKRVSSKCGPSIGASAVCIGLEFSARGIRLSDESIARLKSALAQTPTSGSHLRRILGSINYARSAFQFDRLAGFGETLKVLTPLVNKKPFKISPEAEDALKRLSESIVNAPLGLHSYKDLICGEASSWVVTVDASDLAIGAALFRYNGPSQEVSMEDLKDPEKAVLVGALSRALSGDEVKLMIYEKEMLALMAAMQKWGKLFIATTRPRSPRESQSEAKILVLTDNTISLSRWTTYRLPLSPLISAKSRRFLSWIEEASEWRYLPYTVRHCTGTSNDVADLLSRWHEQLLCQPEEDPRCQGDEAGKDLLPFCMVIPDLLRPADDDMLGEQDYPVMAAAPVTSGAPPEGESPPEECYTAPQVAHVEAPLAALDIIDLNHNQAAVVEKALAEDDSVFQGVRVREIFAVGRKVDHSGLSPLVVEKVSRWFANGIFAIRQPFAGSEVGLLFCQGSLRTSDGPKEVMVIPSDCDVDLQPMVPTLLEDGSDRDMRKSLLMRLHDNLLTAHNSRDRLLGMVLQVAWWPGVSADVKAYRARCPICCPGRYRQPPGVLPDCRTRFDTYSVDLKMIPTGLKERLGLPPSACVVSAIDLATGEVSFELINDQSAANVARFLWHRIIVRHGEFSRLCSDQGSVFVGSVLGAMSNLFGWVVKTSAARNPTGNSRIERAHRAVSQTFRWVESLGDADGPDDLRLYLGSAEAKVNLAANEEGLSPHLAVYGSEPLMPLLKEGVTCELDDLNKDIDKRTIADIREAAVWATEALADSRDVKAFYNRASLAAGSAVDSNTLKLSEHDEVLYEGRREVVKKLFRAPGSDIPIVAVLESGKKVPIGALALLLRSEQLTCRAFCELQDDALVDKFVAFYLPSQDNLVMVGKVIEARCEKVVIWVYDGGAKTTVFLPLWRSDEATKRSKESPGRNWMVLTTEVPASCILARVEIHPNGRVTAASKDRIEALGISRPSDTLLVTNPSQASGPSGAL